MTDEKLVAEPKGPINCGGIGTGGINTTFFQKNKF